METNRNTKRLWIVFSLLAIAAVLLAGYAGARAATPWYVRVDGSDTSCDGSAPEAAPGSVVGKCAFQTIQKAIDSAAAGDSINVYPGLYNQDEANGRDPVTGGAGSNDFNVFVNKALTIQGVTAVGEPITQYADVVATVQSKRNVPSFGTSAIFVQADNVTITGLEITGMTTAPNYNNKTVEVVGDNVTIKDCKLNGLNEAAALYFDDNRYDSGTNTSHLQGYHVEENKIDGGGPDADGIRISSGAGWSGPVSGRVIANNTIFNVIDGIAFVGPGGDPWDVYPVGAATITGNTFSQATKRHIVAWGEYASAQGYGDLDWTGILTSNTFDKAAVTWTPSSTMRYWDSGSFKYVRGIYSKIQPYAITKAQGGDSVQVLPGTYIENLTIDKALTLYGAGMGSTIIQPAVSNPNPCTGSSLCGTITSASNVIGVQASDVLIRDLTIDGDNPALTSGIVRGGADIDARNGIITDHLLAVPFNNLEVHHVEVKNIYLRGMYASTNATFNFHHNTVTNVQGDDYSIGMFAWYGPGTMANNTVSYANDAISANHSKGIQFLNNTVTNSGSGVHTDNAGDGGGVADLIQGNTVSNCASGGYGVWVFVPYLAPTVDQNTVTNCAVGISAWGQGAAVTTTFTNNVVDGQGLVDSVGVYITTDTISWGYRDISVAFNNNVIKNNAYGLQFVANQQSWNPDPFVAKTITATFFDNDISGNTSTAAKDTQGIYNLDASGNWWGTNDPAAVKTAVNGGVGIDYTPWLNGGTDTNPAVGFQGDFSNLWVDDDSPQTGTTGRINEALGMVSGSTVNIAPGTYAETPLTTKDNLTITGSEVSDRPVITGGMNVRSADGVTLRNLVVKGPGSGNTVIDAGGLNFTMDHVTVDGEDVAGRMGVSGGQINGDISVTYSEFLNIKGFAAFDTRSGSGGPTSGADINSFVFSHNTLRNTQGHINARGTIGDPTPNVTFSNNLVEQVGAATNSFGGIFKVFYATNASFTGNTIKDVGTSGYNPVGESAYGAGIMPRNVANLIISGNTFENNNQAIAVEPRNSAPNGHPDGVLSAGVIENNTFTGNKYGVYIPATLHPTSDFNALQVTQNNFSGSTTEAVHNGYTAGIVMAELNWWGAACGPTGTGGADAVSANVDYSPWWTAPGGPGTSSTGSGGELVFPTGSTTASMQAVLSCVAPGSTLLYESGVYPGGLVVNTNSLTFKLNTVTVGPGSPAFTINADDVTVLGPGTLNGSASSDPAILVNGGADNFILQNVQVTNWANAVKVAGSVDSFKLINNWIHSNSSHGLLVDSGAAIGGVVTIQGNLFKVNGGAGVQNNGATANLKAEYNSWGDVAGPTGALGDGIGGSVDADPFTFAEVYLDMDPAMAGDQYQRNVYETQTFDVSLNIEAANLYGASFTFTYDPAMLTLVGLPTFEAPFAGKCVLPPVALPVGTISYVCNLTGGPAWNGSKLATFNFTAGAGVSPSNGPWQTLYDISAAEADTSAGATGGVKVFVNNAGFNLPSAPNRDITDANDGQLDITGIARFKGYIDLQGRGNDSSAVIKVYDNASGTTVFAQGSSASSGAYSTAYQGGNVLQVGVKYYFSVDRDLYLPTAVSGGPWNPNQFLTTRPDTSLVTLLLLGGDATNNNVIDVNDASCIGSAYGGSLNTCTGTGANSDVNGDGIINLYDLVLMGGNFNLTYSSWVP